MKRLFYIPLLFILLFGCKKDKIDMQPDEIIEPLVGKWLLTESEQSVNGKKVWQPVNSNDPQYLVFRFDGVMFDKDGFANCCTPKELSINGNSFTIQPKRKVVYGKCAAVSCAYCAVWGIEYSGNEMILNYCFGVREKYIKN
ncbi:hypothetical protein ACFP1I_20400 [Dyadobacter subterraneus]|uniref:Lipocalin-like domain-containing protein n=1 Tax=Dyadobacter subterraneus TaxID=2773304 RepID=A0ABR9W6W7_9BACT|nr:hypothetical protein [Dyadobacter subterraneus]MBE9461192.1 hypothetical protein [Dyadobacter subterraneus]